jgi:hypothetical protein
MGRNELASNESSSEQNKLRRTIGTMALSAFFFVAIEFEFVRSLIHLIDAHAKSNYIWPALAFQIFLVASLMRYLRFWQRLGEMHASAQEKEKIATDFSSSVFFLLLSLFVFSSVSFFFANAN